MFTEAYSPQEALELADELGIEVDSQEHISLEKSALCSVKVSGTLKRKSA